MHRGCRQGDPVSPYIFILCAEYLSQSIKNNRDIVGLNICGKEKKLTTFADDTSLFLNPSKKVLRKTLQTLSDFEQVSVLKINLSKTKAVWIGSERFRDDGICHDLKLDWVHNFTALGIKYDVRDLINITTLNCADKMNEIEKLLANWNKRNLTLLGRVTVVKSLALSKIVHFLISLPSPQKNFLREIDKKFYKFLWRQKPPKISKKTLEKDFKDGGLQMVNIEQFEHTLKAKWLKKNLTNKGGWADIPVDHNIDAIPHFGSDFINVLLDKVSNPFWKSVLIAIKSFVKIYNTNNFSQLTFNEPLWFNPLIKLSYEKSWDNKGLRILSDLITTYAQFKTKEELQNDFGISLNFLDYARLIRSIPTTWEALRHEWHLTDIKPWCQPFCQVLLCDTKTTQLIKKVFKESNNDQPTAIASWQREITIPTSPTFWDKIFILPFRVGFDHWSKMFQYKILHRILPTNSKLFQYNIKDSELCDFCLIDRESILHIFCECEIATSIWDSVVEWYNSFGYNLDYLSDAQIVFGDPSFDPIFNRIILITKIEIFNSKSKNRRVLLGAIIQRLKYQFQIEKFIATKNGRLKTFRGFWSPIYLYMKDNL